VLEEEFHNQSILPFVEVLVMIDSGSNVNLISKKLATTLGCKTYKVTEELNVTSGKTAITEATSLSLILFKNMTENHQQNILLLHNIPFKLVSTPEYMISLGKQMERKYRVPLRELIEVTELSEIHWMNNNNRIEEVMEAKAIAEEVRHTSPEGYPQDVNQPITIEETTLQGRGMTSETTSQIYPESSSHHSIITSQESIMKAFIHNQRNTKLP